MPFRESLVGYSLLRPGAVSGGPGLTVESARMEGKGFRIACERPSVAVGPVRVLLLGRIHELLTDEFALSRYHGRQEELVAALYERHDIDFRSRVDGHFFIVLHDEKHGRLWLINDRYRATNLYYCEHDGVLYFANSVRLLLLNLPARPELDPRGIPSFLGTGFSYTEKTQLQGVYRLFPTFALCIEGDAFRLSHHWDEQFRFDRRPFEDLEEHLDRYEELFERSIRNHVEQFSPDELGCMLSGGHDTTYTFINAAKAFGKPVHGFTAAFEGFGFDEVPKARFVADKFNGVCHPVSVGPKDLDLIPAMVRAVEEPVSGGSLPIYACAREAARMGMSSVLGGDAGDTLWGEYYPVAEWHSYIRHLPLFARKLLHRLVSSGSKALDWERLWEAEQVFHLFAQKDMYSDFMERLCTYRHYRREMLRDLLDVSSFPSVDPHECLIDLPFTPDNFSDALIEAKMLCGVYPYMIPPTQKALESFGIHFHTPYFNSNLIDFINSLPAEWLNGGSSLSKLTNDAEKRRFHKQALLRHLPRRFVHSVQQSLDVPFHALLNKRPEILDRLLLRLKRRGWYNADFLDRLFHEFPRQKVKPHEIVELRHHGYRIYSLLTLEVWCMEFLDRSPGDPGDEVPPLEEYLA